MRIAKVMQTLLSKVPHQDTSFHTHHKQLRISSTLFLWLHLAFSNVLYLVYCFSIAGYEIFYRAFGVAGTFKYNVCQRRMLDFPEASGQCLVHRQRTHNLG